ncbi:hypothetical protein ECG_09017 [Echinococcus granulosus]|nr:hypothetical protein ECG_09017 [Echinococcus granulosus]
MFIPKTGEHESRPFYSLPLLCAICQQPRLWDGHALSVPEDGKAKVTDDGAAIAAAASAVVAVGLWSVCRNSWGNVVGSPIYLKKKVPPPLHDGSECMILGVRAIRKRFCNLTNGLCIKALSSKNTHPMSQIGRNPAFGQIVKVAIQPCVCMATTTATTTKTTSNTHFVRLFALPSRRTVYSNRCNEEHYARGSGQKVARDN